MVVDYTHTRNCKGYGDTQVSCMTTAPIFKKMKVLKKLKKKIGLSSSCRQQELPPLSFHPVHGDNIRLEANGKIARRSDSFCKGVVFSNRPVKLFERIYVRLAEISTSWSGVIRFGFTTQDPAGLQGALPKYVCPDLTNKPGYWAKALSDRHATQGLMISYYVSSAGDVHFAINGEEKGIFFSGVETKGSLWTVIDVYGNCTAIEFLDAYSTNNRFQIVNNLHPQRQTFVSRVADTAPYRPPPPPCMSIDLSSQMSQLNITPSSVAIPQHYPSHGINTFPFHSVRGRHITFNSDRTVASRDRSEYSQGYVFSMRPLRPGEHFLIEILDTMPSFVGGLSFGLTSANPAGLDADDLPENCDLLLDRPEYWVVSKNVALSPSIGCEVGFGLSRKGEVLMSKNGRSLQVVMHVDISQPLWAFCDLFGNTREIKMLGILPESTPMSYPVAAPRTAVRHFEPQQQQLPADRVDEDCHECTVCYEGAVDSVLYSCGHMCMCYDCAIRQWRGRGGGHCPICRAVIRDVIRTYRS